MQETELYITELKDHIILPDGDQIYHEENVLSIPSEENIVEEGVEHLVVDGQVSYTNFIDQVSDLSL